MPGGMDVRICILFDRGTMTSCNSMSSVESGPTFAVAWPMDQPSCYFATESSALGQDVATLLSSYSTQPCMSVVSVVFMHDF